MERLQIKINDITICKKVLIHSGRYTSPYIAVVMHYVTI